VNNVQPLEEYWTALVLIDCDSIATAIAELESEAVEMKKKMNKIRDSS